MTFDNLPARRGYRWNGNRWVNIRVDRAVRRGAVVALILVFAVTGYGLVMLFAAKATGL